MNIWRRIWRSQRRRKTAAAEVTALQSATADVAVENVVRVVIGDVVVHARGPIRPTSAAPDPGAKNEDADTVHLQNVRGRLRR